VPTLGSGMDTVTLDSGACEALIGMAQSECCDVQREGLQALASASATSDNQLRLIQADAKSETSLVGLLAQVLASPDDVVRRCASLLLTNLSQQEAIRPVLVHELCEIMLEQLDAPAALGNRETKRHLAATLAAISSTHASALPKDLAALARYAQCSDYELRTAVNKTLTNVRCV
jgi:hypothetical protein